MVKAPSQGFADGTRAPLLVPAVPLLLGLVAAVRVRTAAAAYPGRRRRADAAGRRLDTDGDAELTVVRR